MSIINLNTIEDLQKYESEENFQKLKEANEFDGKIYKEIIEKFNYYLKNLPQEEPEIEKVEFIIQYELQYGEIFGIKGKQALLGGWDGEQCKYTFTWNENHIWKLEFLFDDISKETELEFKFVKLRDKKIVSWEKLENVENRKINVQEDIKIVKNKDLKFNNNNHIIKIEENVLQYYFTIKL